MYYKDFLELDLPIGTKVRYKDKEWLFVGYGKNSNSKMTIQLTKNDSSNGYPSYNAIYSWEDDEIEIMGIPKGYTTLPKYHVGDIVYYKEVMCIVVEERDEDGEYKVYNTSERTTFLEQEEELSLEPILELEEIEKGE
jgi:hypothetical protein